MFFIKSIPANIRYYLRQSIVIYLVDCFFLGGMIITLSLISLERYDLHRLEKQLANFSHAKQGADPLNQLIEGKHLLLGRYQLIGLLMMIITIILVGILAGQAFKKLRQDIETFSSAAWPQYKIVNYYTLIALCILVLASITVIVGWLVLNSYYWHGLEVVNQRWLQKPFRPVQGPQALQPLFKNHLTDFSSRSLLNPVLHESTKQSLTNQVLRRLWLPLLSLIVPIFIVGWYQVNHFSKMRKL
ncbi:hypothetical protein [Latilactobacillus graminis]|uniref:Uncharacterized protein n=2 Tax=Latilactobacillus graminis TaxID=60519 RepID=A0AA89L4T9_9LACO|nr:hypothetical protein [Latilactobacillus graminis]KRM22432.1 hypothetical protein FC90_GL001035 [Latilactobacillus graminis DSM 20719]QFP79399.1 hypothetical protein LG542_03780 [Latilactobacillus graminis]